MIPISGGQQGGSSVQRPTIIFLGGQQADESAADFRHVDKLNSTYRAAFLGGRLLLDERHCDPSPMRRLQRKRGNILGIRRGTD